MRYDYNDVKRKVPKPELGVPLIKTKKNNYLQSCKYVKISSSSRCFAIEPMLLPDSGESVSSRLPLEGDYTASPLNISLTYQRDIEG